MDWPLIIAGPILRRVDPGLVSVWVALSEPKIVGVRIWPGLVDTGPGTNMYSGPEPLESAVAFTERFAEKLHIALVVVEVPPATPLLPGRIYSYQVTIGTDADLKSLGLLQDKLVDSSPHLALGYEPNFLPSFAMPPEELTDLRLVHASCRKPHGPGRDGLASLDHIIKQSRTNGIERPHQCFLTGDQIYADDVAMALLPSLFEIGSQLLSGGDATTPEKIPLGGEMWSATLANFPPGRRQKLIDNYAKFTSDEAACHLMSFGEFCAMYLLAFSNALWMDELPDKFEDVVKDFTPETEPFLTPFQEARELKRDFKGQLKELESFRETLPNAQRAIANVPVWMTFDDHEITDDWFLTKAWKQRALNSPLGRTIIRNGLITYGLFQAWGNDPLAFATGLHAEMLARAKELFPSPAAEGPNETAASRLDEIFGLTGSDPPITWHYSAPGAKHCVLALDTRTRRSFDTPFSPPGLLSASALAQQIPPGPRPAGIEVIVVLSPAPVLGLGVLEELVQPLGSRIVETIHAHSPEESKGATKLDLEAWSYDPFSFEALLRRLQPYEQIVFLSGDVHYGIGLEMSYWKGNALSARFAQLTSSALKNEKSDIAFLASTPLAQWVFGHAFTPLRRLGWDKPNPEPVNVPDSAVPYFHRVRLDQTPVLLATRGWPSGSKITRSPDWAWELNIVKDHRPDDDSPNARPPVIQPDPITPDVAPGDAIEGYLRTAHRYSTIFKKTAPRSVLFAANIGLVRFERKAGDLSVRHSLYSVHPEAIFPEEPEAHSVQVISLKLSIREPPTIETDR